MANKAIEDKHIIIRRSFFKICISKNINYQENDEDVI